MIDVINTLNADIFIARNDQSGFDYYYGGTRMYPSNTDSTELKSVLARFMRDESSLKNFLMNWALRDNALSKLDSNRLPKHFLESRVSGARCIIRPKTQKIEEILLSPNNKDFQKTVKPILEAIGKYLNAAKGTIKLTPDFGRFSGMADMLHEYTEHSLGINCDDGGCGGKSSYTTTGIKAVFETLGLHKKHNLPLTLIGSAGAIGTEFLDYVKAMPFKDVSVCDLYYDEVSKEAIPNGITHLPAKRGKFTNESLSRGGIIVATTLGNELQNSDWQKIPRNTVLLLGHNLATPEGIAGIDLMDKLHKNGVIAIPGQLLTLGGSLTSRLEWYWRTERIGESFDKPLAHIVVSQVISLLTTEIMRISYSENLSPFEAMHKLIVQ